MHCVYVLLSSRDLRFYTGCTADLKERVRLHQSGRVESTKDRLPMSLVYYEACIHRNDAFRREKYLKTTYGHRYIRNRLRSYFTGQERGDVFTN
jgi:putative endonuclease